MQIRRLTRNAGLTIGRELEQRSRVHVGSHCSNPAPSQHAQPLAAVPRHQRHGVKPRGAGRRQLLC